MVVPNSLLEAVQLVFLVITAYKEFAKHFVLLGTLKVYKFVMKM